MSTRSAESWPSPPRPAGRTPAELAERLTAPLESALRLALLDALSAAAAEITRDMAPGSVDVRLRGREPSFVVTAQPTDRSPDPQGGFMASVPPPAVTDGDEGGAMARINLRLAEDLKVRVEESARQGGISVNTWLVRAASSVLHSGAGDHQVERRTPRGGERFTGWVR